MSSTSQVGLVDADDTLSAPTIIPAAYSVDEFCTVSSLGRSYTYAAIKAGELKARKAGRRTLILHDEAMRFLRSLPAMGEVPTP